MTSERWRVGMGKLRERWELRPVKNRVRHLYIHVFFPLVAWFLAAWFAFIYAASHLLRHFLPLPLFILFYYPVLGAFCLTTQKAGLALMRTKSQKYTNVTRSAMGADDLGECADGSHHVRLNFTTTVGEGRLAECRMESMDMHVHPDGTWTFLSTTDSLLDCAGGTKFPQPL